MIPLVHHELVNKTSDRRFLLTNQDGYEMTYNGLALVVKKRRSHGWQTFGFGGPRRIELPLDVLNVLNETAEEGVVSENLSSPNFRLPSTFVDPRRAMVGLRMNLGR